MTGPYRPVKRTGPLTTVQHRTLSSTCTLCVYMYLQHLYPALITPPALLIYSATIAPPVLLIYPAVITPPVLLIYPAVITPQLLHLSYYTSSTIDISGSYYTSVITHQLLHLQRLNPSIHQKPDAGPVCEASETDTHTERTDRLTHRHPSHSQPSPSPPRFSTQPGSSGFRCPRPANCAETNCHGIRTPTKQRQDRNVPADTSRLLTNRLQRIV